MLSVAAFMMCDSDDTHIEISFHEEEVEVEPTEFDNPTALTDTESLDEITRRTCSSTGEDVTRKKCVICHTDTDEHLTAVSRGLATLRQQFILTDQSHLADQLDVQPDTPVTVHGSCRRRLSYEANRSGRMEDETKSSVRRKTRSLTGVFSFATMCFLCGESVTGSKDYRKVLSGKEFDERITSAIRERNFDTWATTVQGRMDNVNDLFAADAVYHRNCHTRFIANLPHTPCKAKRGRPMDTDASHAFDSLCDKLETECDNELYTLQELTDMMSELTDSKEDCSIYTNRYLKQLLQNRYGEHIYFASRPGREDVVGFSNFCDLLLHDKFFTDRSEGNGSEAEKLVRKAGRLILAEIREQQCKREFYPTADDIISEGTRFVPSLLNCLLECVIRSPLKQASIGQAIVQAAKPRGSLMPLLFGIAVDLEQCSQQVHIQLSRMGFSSTPAEVRHYKHSVMQSLPDEVHMKPTAVTQFVADNLDHNVKTLDGLNTFHGMGIVSATVVPPGTFGVSGKLVRRLDSPMKASDATKKHVCAHSDIQQLVSRRFAQCEAQCNSVTATSIGVTSHNQSWHVMACRWTA